ncbi:MAG TPA: Crp/Fnr family transcriptional regulator [Solirubrobacteraceae bacterium]|jgi:DNA-binding transcriptional ArsR family regulator|nr:Crp/Fnr family transcriptional regulator [Solirubrobacteraceae bacterium]
MASRPIHLLDADPDLANGLSDDEFPLARKLAVARVVEAHGSQWSPDEISRQAGPGWLGLFVVRGVLMRTVHVDSRVACEIFGPGDLFRPWDADGEYAPLAIGLGWRVPRTAQLALLDRDFAGRIARWPTITAELISRVARRARALALNQAASHLSHAHARLAIAFWLLGERWGRVGTEGITITLPLTHETLAMLVGVRRPTVTLALKRLSEAGLLERHGSDRWLLTNRAVNALTRGDGQRLDLLGERDLPVLGGP